VDARTGGRAEARTDGGRLTAPRRERPLRQASQLGGGQPAFEHGEQHALTACSSRARGRAGAVTVGSSTPTKVEAGVRDSAAAVRAVCAVAAAAALGF
jgi:hypothetical protein